MHNASARAAAEGPRPTLPGVDSGDRPQYTSVASIAKGGMGYVELCCRREGRFLRWAARKRVHEQFRSDPQFRSMFMDEARLAGLVRHPNIVSVSDVGEDADGPFLIMDYVEGVSLSRLARQAKRVGHPIPLQVAVRICKDAATGLHAAHEVRAEDGSILQLVHRDVSPQNILVGFDGSVRVTDFGIAKALGNASHTTAGILKGNMAYLSPEQLRFEEPDRRSDIFSLGVTLFELLSGARLYPNRSGFDGTRRILVEPPPDIRMLRADVPEPLVELLFQMLAKEPAGRPATAREVAACLESILMGLIAAEAPLTVAEYMDRHFAAARDRQRQLLAQHLHRVDGGGAERASSSSSSSSSFWPEILPEHADTKLESGPLLRRRPGRRTSAVASASAVVLLAAAMLAVPRLARHPAPRPAPVAMATPPRRAQMEIVRLPPPVAAPAVEPPASPTPGPSAPAASLQAAAESPHVSRPQHDRPRRARSRHGLVAKVHIDPARPGRIAVPLYTQWR